MHAVHTISCLASLTPLLYTYRVPPELSRLPAAVHIPIDAMPRPRAAHWSVSCSVSSTPHSNLLSTTWASRIGCELLYMLASTTLIPLPPTPMGRLIVPLVQCMARTPQMSTLSSATLFQKSLLIDSIRNWPYLV